MENITLDSTLAAIVAAYNDAATALGLDTRSTFKNKQTALDAYLELAAQLTPADAEPEVAPTRTVSNRAGFKGDQKITLLVDANPKRKNTPAAARWFALATSPTVADFEAQVGRRAALGDLHHAVKTGLVMVA